MTENKHTGFKHGDSRKENFFLTPDNYFSELNEKVFQRITDEKTRLATKNERQRWVIRTQLAFAAGIIGFALIIFSGVHMMFGNKGLKESSGIYITELTELEFGNISDDMLFEMIESFPIESEINYVMEDLIIEYLMNSKVNYETIIKEL